MKKNNILISTVVILSISVLGLGSYIIYDKTKTEEKIEVDNLNSNNTTNDSCNVVIKNEKELNLSNINVKIDNGNIVFTSDNKEKVFSQTNAKYIYLTSYLETSNTRLYYINNNNELYYKNLYPFDTNTFFDNETTNYGIKIVDNVVAFVGTSTAMKYDNDGKVVETTPVLNVLLNDGRIYNIDYTSK